MSMNILVEMKVASKTIFAKENRPLGVGEIAITKDLTDVRIGNGENKWVELTPLELPREVIEKWYNIATGTTSSHLVTLPDMNFAYTTVNADSSSLVEEVIGTIFKDKNYVALEEKQNTTIGENRIGLLNFFSSATSAFDIIFDTKSIQETIQGIDSLSFTSKFDEETREFFLVDSNGRKLIDNLDKALESTNLTLKGLDNQINDKQNGIDAKIKKYLIPFKEAEVGGMGLVNRPSDGQRDAGNYYLNANGNWTQILLAGNKIPLELGKPQTTIFDAITELRNRQTQISVTEDTTSEKLYVLGIRSNEATGSVTKMYYASQVYVNAKNNVLIGAAYNDYAEARETKPVSAGHVVVENGDDTLSISTERLMLGGNIVSDTYGMLIGETDKAKTPIALCGRVLAYPFEDKEEYYPGAPVCTGPNGTVSLMSKDEVLHYPECIIGYVSAIPNYEEWNGKKVNGRIWIKVV